MKKMKKMQFLAALALFAALLAPKASLGLTVTDLDSTAPTDYTFAQTSYKGSGLPPSNNTGAANNTPGQTFTISSLGSLPSYDNALELTQIDFKDNDTTGGTLSDLNLTLTIGTVSTEGTFTAIDTEMATGVTVGAEDYVQLSLSSYVVLDANTEYAFFISTNGNVHLDGASNPDFSGFITGDSASVNDTTDDVTTGTGSRTFYLDTVPVPEPADWALVPVIGTIAFFGMRRLRASGVLA
jgi:hypothetical protein